MTFKIGDRVTTKKEGNIYYMEYGVGTIIEILTNPMNLANSNGEPWCYISWDKPTSETYAHKVARNLYRHVYGFFATSLELVQSAKVNPNDPVLPTDPRLRDIALKIRDIEYRFKNRHNTYAYNNKERVLSDFQRSKVCTG
jgi:hypothetical protein